MTYQAPRCLGDLADEGHRIWLNDQGITVDIDALVYRLLEDTASWTLLRARLGAYFGPSSAVHPAVMDAAQ